MCGRGKQRHAETCVSCVPLRRVLKTGSTWTIYLAPDRPSFLGWKIEPAPGKLGGIDRSPALDPANGRLDRSPQADAAAPTRAARLRNPRLVDLPAASDASATIASFWRACRPVAFYCATARFQLRLFTWVRRHSALPNGFAAGGVHEPVSVSHVDKFPCEIRRAGVLTPVFG